MLMSPQIGGAGMGATTSYLMEGSRVVLVGHSIGRATSSQTAAAEKQGRVVLSQPKVKRQVEKEKVRYVAVPVERAPSQKQGKGKAMMKVDTSTGKPQGEVFAADDEKPRSGSTIKLGGDPTLYFASAEDQI